MNRALALFVAKLDHPDGAGEVETVLAAHWRVLDEAVHRWAAIALDAVAAHTEAQWLRALPVLRPTTVDQALQVLSHIRESRQGLCPEAVRHAIAALSPMQSMSRAAPKDSWALLATSATSAARVANSAGPAARADARKLAAELAAGFKG